MKRNKPYRARKSARRKSSDSPGHDAFLDIVANLVGILIILVVVVGAHAGASLSFRSDEDNSELDQKLQTAKRELEREIRLTSNLHTDHAKMTGMASDERQLFLALQQQRKDLLVQIKQIEAEIDTHTASLQDQEREKTQAIQRRVELEAQWDAAQRELAAIEAAQSKNDQTIVHYPTPLAKTVFSEEVHCRVKEGRIVWVPIEELVSEMRSEWKLKAEKLKTADRTVETVGPIDHFRLQYTLEAVEKQALGEFGRITERAVEFRRFVILPTSDNLGTKIDDALKPNSPFLKTLEFLEPAKTTISIWVYSDSYSEFNDVKELLQSKGFRTAVWPLSNGKLISGGPNGYRSTAQ